MSDNLNIICLSVTLIFHVRNSDALSLRRLTWKVINNIIQMHRNYLVLKGTKILVLLLEDWLTELITRPNEEKTEGLHSDLLWKFAQALVLGVLRRN